MIDWKNINWLPEWFHHWIYKYQPLRFLLFDIFTQLYCSKFGGQFRLSPSYCSYLNNLLINLTALMARDSISIFSLSSLLTLPITLMRAQSSSRSTIRVDFLCQISGNEHANSKSRHLCSAKRCSLFTHTLTAISFVCRKENRICQLILEFRNRSEQALNFWSEM